MKNKLVNCKIRRRILLFCLCLTGMLLLQGCELPLIDRLRFGDMAGVFSNCIVFSVDGSIGDYNYLCSNSTHTYVYHDDAVCDYDTMEELIKVDDRIGHIACTDDALYYTMENYALYCYDLSQAKSNLITDEYSIVGMKANRDDVFVLQKIKGPEYENPEKDKYFLMYYHKDEEGINLSEWVAEHDENSNTDIYGIYEFEDYTIIVDKSISKDIPHIVYIETADGFQYSCDVDNAYGKIQQEYIRLSRDVKSRYLGEEEEISRIVEENDQFAGISASQVGFSGDSVFILEQYCRGAFGYQENPSKEFKVADALFEFVPETGECELIYRNRKKEQIAGFCCEKHCLYLLRNDGVYRHDWDTGKEKRVLKNKYYDDFAFEYSDDRLFIFKSDSRETEFELVKVVE